MRWDWGSPMDPGSATRSARGLAKGWATGSA